MWQKPTYDLPAPNHDLPRNGGLGRVSVPVAVSEAEQRRRVVAMRNGALQTLHTGDLRQGGSIFRDDPHGDWSWLDPTVFEAMCLADARLQSLLAKAAKRKVPYDSHALVAVSARLDELFDQYVCDVFAKFEACKATISQYLAARHAAEVANPTYFARKD